VHADGFVYIAFGHRGDRLKPWAKRNGASFVPWGPHDGTVIIYRNMAANTAFPYTVGAMVPVDADAPSEGQSAESFIGEYAPVGVEVDVDALLAATEPGALF
jgi:hypothetical protein